MMKYELYATSSTCYDESGMTYPRKVPFDFEAAIKKIFKTKTKWECRLGYSNLPKVLTFATGEADNFSTKYEEFTDLLSNNDMGFNFLIIEHWTIK